MWLKHVRGSLLGLSLFTGLAAFAGSISAATVTVDGQDATNTTVQIANGDKSNPDAVPIVVSEDSTWDITVTIASNITGGPVTGFTISNGSTTESGVLTSDGVGYALRYAFTQAGTYSLSTSLDPAIGYQVTMSAVPLPAAAWMFLSMLFGGAWIKRRSTRSKGGVVATA